jgi:hypothetical protein
MRCQQEVLMKSTLKTDGNCGETFKLDKILERRL